MATGGPTGAATQQPGMVHLTDEYPVRAGLDLPMAAEAEIGVALHEHAAVHSAVRLVACHAALAQGLVLKHVRRALFLVAPDADGVALLQPQAAGGLVNILAVRLVAIDTGHAPLEHAMMVRHGELAVCRNVALEAGDRIVARIHDVRRQAGLDVFLPAPGHDSQPATEAQCTSLPR